MSAIKLTRPKPKNRLGVDVGPFLNIIVCVIGVVVLLVCGLVAVDSHAAPANDDGLPRRIALAERILQLRQSHEELAAELARANAALDSHNQLLADYQAALDEAKNAGAKAADPELLARVGLLKQVSEMQDEQASLQTQLDGLARNIHEAQQKVHDQETYVTIPADGSNARAVFIECHAAGITIFQRAGEQVTTTKVDLKTIESSRDLARVIDDAARSHGDMVLNILVRPTGIKAYDRTIVRVYKAEPPFASMPISAKGIIRFAEPTIH